MHPSAPPGEVGFGSFTAHGYPEAMMHNQQIPTMATRQPYPSPYAPAGNMQWSTALCHCFDDPQNCLITSFCPCITFGQVSEIINKGNTSCAASGAMYGILIAFTGLPCLYSCFYRSKLRGQYDLEEAPFNDCLLHFCCEGCALCQEYRELKNRGFDMGIGWQANIDRKNRGVTVAPIQRGMSR